MKRSILRAFALCFSTAFVAGTVSAQDERSNEGGAAKAGSSPAGVSRTPTSGNTPGIYGNSVSSTANRSTQPVRLSKLMNSTLKGQTGDSYGQVQDIIVDPSTGQAQFVIISRSTGSATTPGVGSVTGTSTSPSSSGQLVAIPFQLVNTSGASDFMAMIDRTALQNAPSFDSSSWPAMDSQWTQRINSHFGVSNMGAPGTSGGVGTGTQLRNSSAPGAPGTLGTPDIYAPGARPGTLSPGTGTGTTPNTGTGTGTGTGGAGTGGTGGGGGAGGAGGSGGGK